MVCDTLSELLAGVEDLLQSLAAQPGTIYLYFWACFLVC